MLGRLDFGMFLSRVTHEKMGTKEIHILVTNGRSLVGCLSLLGIALYEPLFVPAVTSQLFVHRLTGTMYWVHS